jgi:inositol 1,4,5-triphosphate receptor type 1
VIILINISAGIIIDKFGDLRESENEKAKDIEGSCFICGISKFHI